MTHIPAWLDGRLQPVEKLRVHREGLRHKAVSVFVTDGNRVLLQRRSPLKYHTPGLWTNTCCTHPAWAEEAQDCAVRRLWEELGITGLHPRFRERAEYRADVGRGMTEHEVVDIFVAEAPADLSVAPAAAEVAAIRWVGLNALRETVARNPGDYTPWLRIYLEEHRRTIFGAAAG